VEALGKKGWRGVQLGVALFALIVSWDAGRRGFMPLDQSVVFDGGWRILSGQIPWRDFHAPSFVTPSAIQAGFFGLFGVNWWSYLAHAMLANALFAILVVALARRLHLGPIVSAILGLGSAVIFYPPIGTPFADQEAFLFSLAAIACAFLARTQPASAEVSEESEAQAKPTKKTLFLWALVPPLLVLAFLSKQLPGALVPVAIALILILPSARPRREGLMGLGLGLVAVVVLASLLMVGLGIEPGRISYDLFELPLGEAEVRRSYLPKGIVRLLQHFLSAGTGQGLFVAWWLHAAALCVLAAEAVKRRARLLTSEAVQLVVLGELLFHLNIVTLVLTNNQDGGGVAWFFLAAAPVLAGLRLAFQRTVRIPLVASALLVALVATDSARFQTANNWTRAVNDMQFTGGEAAGEQLAELAPILWATPGYRGYPLADLAGVVKALRGRSGELFLVGDSAVIYGLVGTRSTSPSLWFHPGVSFPKRGTKGFSEWQASLVEGVRSGRIGRIVEEVAGTWIGSLRLSDFPRINGAVRKRGYTVEEFGAFRILELTPLDSADAAVPSR